MEDHDNPRQRAYSAFILDDSFFIYGGIQRTVAYLVEEEQVTGQSLAGKVRDESREVIEKFQDRG